jgi:hypothetical protein
MRKSTGLEARMRDALSAAVIMCGLLSGCARTPNTIRDLPELPAEFARDLAVARTAPVLMTRPAATPAPPLGLGLRAPPCRSLGRRARHIGMAMSSIRSRCAIRRTSFMRRSS